MSEQTKTAVKQGGMNTKVRYITVTAMLSAVAFVLMYLEIAIPIMPSFIKFDFSDLPALLGSFALGPVCPCCWPFSCVRLPGVWDKFST